MPLTELSIYEIEEMDCLYFTDIGSDRSLLQL